MAKEEKNGIARFWDGIRTEFAKIAWPTPEDVAKQSAAVVAVSVISALLIVVIDMVVQYGVDLLIQL